VLSLATLSFDVRNDIPYVPYVTALDWFLIMCYLFLFASLLEFTAVHYFTKVGYGDFVQTYEDAYEEKEVDSSDETIAFNRRFQQADEASISAGGIEQGSNVGRRRRKTLRQHLSTFWKCISSDPLYKRQMAKRAHFKGINSVSQLDIMSRYLFPASFFLLNLIYWSTYYYKYI
jgi:gamma-aminobutyric acid receptor subunit alpha